MKTYLVMTTREKIEYLETIKKGLKRQAARDEIDGEIRELKEKEKAIKA